MSEAEKYVVSWGTVGDSHRDGSYDVLWYVGIEDENIHEMAFDTEHEATAKAEELNAKQGGEG